MAIPLVSRATVMSNRGIVASTSPLAASAGLRVLSQGGNAFDAAVATAAVEAVTVPGMCGLGGEVFAILYEAEDGQGARTNVDGGGAKGSHARFLPFQGLPTHALRRPAGGFASR